MSEKDELLQRVCEAVRLALVEKYGYADLEVSLDPSSGEWQCNYDIDLGREGRILAQAVKQGVIGRLREYERRIGEVVAVTVTHMRGSDAIVAFDSGIRGTVRNASGVSQVACAPGDRIRAVIREVRQQRTGGRIEVILELE